MPTEGKGARRSTTYTVQDYRLFVKDGCGNPIPVPNVSIQHTRPVGGLVACTFTITHGDFPDILDTIFPRNWYLVYQTAADAQEFFDPNRPGSMLVLKDAQIQHVLPEFACLMVDANTGQVHTPKPEFTLTFRRVDYA